MRSLSQRPPRGIARAATTDPVATGAAPAAAAPLQASVAILAVALAVVAMTGMGGCQSAADLEPAPAARKVAGLQDAARDVVQDVQLTAQTVPWPGPQDIEAKVTPVRVTLTNHSDRAVRVRFQEFALVADDGRRYSALPPWQMEGTVTEQMEARVVAPLHDPLFIHRGFHIAPAYRTLYPGWDYWAGPFAYDPWYYDAYATYWREIPLPTPTMQARGLPEGVLDPAGHLEGWLYFEHVDPDHDQVVLRYDLVDADTGREAGEMRIPFLVASD